MADRGEIRAGLFVLVALAILAAGTLWIIGFSPWGGGRQRYEVSMKTSGAIRSGDPVRVAGIAVGRVDRVELASGSDWPVTFGVSLDRAIQLTAGTSARITSEGLLGASYLEILPGPSDGEPLPEGSRIVGQEGGTLSQTLEGMAETTDRLPQLLDQATATLGRLDREIEPILQRLQRLLSDENLDSVSTVLEDLKPTVRDVGTRLSALAEQLESLANELEEGLGGVPELTAEVRELVAGVHTALGPDGANLTEILESAKTTLDSAQGVASTLDGGSEDLDAMLRDLRQASANLRSLSQSLKESPGLLLRRRPAPQRKPGDGDER